MRMASTSSSSRGRASCRGRAGCPASRRRGETIRASGWRPRPAPRRGWPGTAARAPTRRSFRLRRSQCAQAIGSHIPAHSISPGATPWNSLASACGQTVRCAGQGAGEAWKPLDWMRRRHVAPGVTPAVAAIPATSRALRTPGPSERGQVRPAHVPAGSDPRRDLRDPADRVRVRHGVFRIELLRPGPSFFLGPNNFTIRMPADSNFLNSIPRTILFAAVTTIVTVPLAVAAALIMNRHWRSASLIGVALLLPWAVAPVVTGFYWRFMFQPTFGVMTQIVNPLGSRAAPCPGFRTPIPRWPSRSWQPRGERFRCWRCCCSPRSRRSPRRTSAPRGWTEPEPGRPSGG